MREALVNPKNVGWGGNPLEVVEQYLPRNYQAEMVPALYDEGDMIRIYGEDSGGWTLDGYVIPRLASGMIFAREVTDE